MGNAGGVVTTCSQQELKGILAEQIIEKQKETREFLAEYGSTSLGEVTISQAYGGARGVKCMVWETSNLDSEEVRQVSDARIRTSI